MRTVESFSTFATRYAQAMTDRRTYVTFGGQEAFTDGRRINLPAMAAGTLLTPWQSKVHAGYLDHEIAHLKYTNFENIRFDRQKQPLLHTLWNVFEDIRIENKLIKEYPPTKVYLDACTQQIEYDKRDKEDKAKGSLGYQILTAIYRHCYEDYRHADVTFEQKETIDQFPDLKPIQEELKALPFLKNEGEAADLAQRVYDLLPKNADYTVPGRSLRPGELMEFPFIVIGVPGNGQGLATMIPAAILFLAMNERRDAMEEMAETIELENSPPVTIKNQDWNGDNILPPVGTDQDRIFVPSGKDHRSFEFIRTNASAEITAAKRMLQIYLRSRSKRAWEKGLPTGSLDDEAIPSMFAGNQNLFMERRDRTLIDTAVQEMVDNSGSMNANATRTAAIISAEALNGVPAIKLSVAGFTTNSAMYTQGSGGRMNGLDILMYKDFDEPYNQARDRLGAIRCTGYTPLGDAYGHGFARLVVRKERKRVLWLISDGDPCIDLMDHSHNEFHLMRKTYRRCKAHNILVICMNIGRMSNEMKRCCDIARNVSSHRELPAAMLEMMKEIAS